MIAILNRQRIPVDVHHIRRTLRLTLRALGVADHEMSLTLVDDRGIRGLNARYRGVRMATDVLAFPLAGPAPVLGEALISVETARRHARGLGHSLREELDLLCCHACLHLVGYDDRDPLEARLMHAREMALLGRLYARPAATLHVGNSKGGLRPPSEPPPGGWRGRSPRSERNAVRARSGGSGVPKSKGYPRRRHGWPLGAEHRVVVDRA